METNSKTISSIPKDERPYEKCMSFGVDSLSDAELLALILRSGTKGVGALEIARQVLDLNGGGLLGLYHVTASELTQIPGIGSVKALQLTAISELAKRMSRSKKNIRKGAFTSPSDVAAYYMEFLRHKEREEMLAVFLDTKGFLIKDARISIGTVNTSICSSREIFAEALKYQAVSMILVHNHPSGDPEPSEADVEATLTLMEAGELLGIKLLDHLIIGDNCYTSLRERGIIPNEQS